MFLNPAHGSIRSKWILVLVAMILAVYFYTNYTGFVEARYRAGANAKAEEIRVRVNKAYRDQQFASTPGIYCIPSANSEPESLIILVEKDHSGQTSRPRTLVAYLSTETSCTAYTPFEPNQVQKEIASIYDPTNGTYDDVSNPKMAFRLKLNVADNEWVKLP